MLKQSMKWSWILILAVAAFMVACDKEQTDSLTFNLLSVLGIFVMIQLLKWAW